MHGKNHDMKIPKRCFKNVVYFKYLGTAVTNQNSIQEKCKKGTEFGQQLIPFGP
jgi:hypothetical protein